MGFLGISGKTWKNIGKIALKAAPIVAAPFTGGASLLALGAGTGAVSGALGGGGWKGALTGGALGAIPGVGGVAGKAITGTVGKTLLNAGLGAAQGGLSGGGVKGALTGAALGGAGTAGGAVGKIANPATRQLASAGVGAGTGALTGGKAGAITGAVGSLLPQGTSRPPAVENVSSFLPQTGAASGGGMAGGIDWRGLLNQGLNTGVNAGVTALANRAGGGGGAVSPPFTTVGFDGRPVGTPGGYGGGRSTGQTFPTGTPGQTSRPTAPGTPPGQSPQQQQQQQAGGGTGFWEKYGPLIAQGGGLAGGMLAGKWATSMAQKRSPEELAALAGAQNAANTSIRYGGQAVGQGLDYTQKPGEYYQTLLSGNRAAMSQAVAAPTAQLTGVYRGAQRNLQQSGIRGAARDVAAGDLNRDRASKIAGLVTGVQPYAADSLAKLGTDVMGQGGQLLGQGGNLQGYLLGQGYENRKYAREEGGKTGAAIGGLARDLGEVAFKKGQPAPTPQGGTPRMPAPAQPGQTGWSLPTGTPLPPMQAPTAPAQGGTATPPLPFNIGHYATFGKPKAQPARPYPDWAVQF